MRHSGGLERAGEAAAFETRALEAFRAAFEVQYSGERVPLLSAPRAAEERSEQDGRLSLVDLRPDRTGLLQARQRDYLAEVTAVQLHEEEVEVHLRTIGLNVDTLVPLLASPVRAVPGTLMAEPGGRAVLRFPLTATRWGVDDLVLVEARLERGRERERAHARERAAVPPDGRSYRIDDPGFLRHATVVRLSCRSGRARSRSS